MSLEKRKERPFFGLQSSTPMQFGADDRTFKPTGSSESKPFGQRNGPAFPRQARHAVLHENMKKVTSAPPKGVFHATTGAFSLSSWIDSSVDTNQEITRKPTPHAARRTQHSRARTSKFGAVGADETRFIVE